MYACIPSRELSGEHMNGHYLESARLFETYDEALAKARELAEFTPMCVVQLVHLDTLEA